jgi:hypothetical protein
VQFAAGIMSYFLFHGIKLYNILIISCLISIVKYNNNNNNINNNYNNNNNNDNNKNDNNNNNKNKYTNVIFSTKTNILRIFIMLFIHGLKLSWLKEVLVPTNKSPWKITRFAGGSWDVYCMHVGIVPAGH